MFPHCRYTKYLYPVECKNNSFSNPNDLQSAIEGNKREGRTSSFGPYGGMPMQHSPLPPSLGGGMHMMGMMGTPPRPMQINGNRPPMHPGNADPLSLSTPSCPMSSSLLSLSQWWISPGQGRDVNIPTLRDLNQWDDETSILRPHHHGGRKLQQSEWQPMVTRHLVTPVHHSASGDWLKCSKSVNNLGQIKTGDKGNCGPLPLPWQFLTIDQFPRFNNLKLDWLTTWRI